MTLCAGSELNTEGNENQKEFEKRFHETNVITKNKAHLCEQANKKACIVCETL